MKKINLIARFSIIAFVAMVVFGFAFGKLLGDAMEKSMFQNSVDETAHIVAQNIIKHFQASDLSEPKSGRKHHKFQHKMDHLSLGKDILKVKIWNRDRLLVWDEDKNNVNQSPQSPEESEELTEAFHGEIHAEVFNADELRQKNYKDMGAERILEMYVPVRFEPDGDVANVFEIYQDINSLYAGIAHHKKVIWFWTISGFSALYIVLFGGFWDASRRIKKQTKENQVLQEQFLQMQKMESVGRLAGGVAHDFNNIISVILGFSELTLKEVPEDSILRDNVQTIHGAGEKAAALTRQLLAFSRKQVLEVRAVNIDTVIEHMIKMLRRLLPANVSLEFNAGLRQQLIMADHTQLEQILLNLVVNARDAMPSGGSLIIHTSSLELKEKHLLGSDNVKPGSYIKIAVTDTGAGISKDVIANIFEPFFSTKGVGKGTGMGLSTVYGIVKQHKGYIDVISSLNKGTTFTVYFPVAERVTEETVKASPDRDVRGSETVLIADDEPMILKVIVNMLKPLGYHVLEAMSAEEALAVSEKYEGEVHLLLTDVVMPGLNGNELAEILTTAREEMKVIFMSGYTEDILAPHGVLGEGLILINKPITEKTLTSKIREVLDSDDGRNPVQYESRDIGDIHILAVDDNDDMRLLIQSYLKNAPCRLEIADNGETAISRFTSGTYDLVLMDVQMPVMDGLTAVREMRKWEKENHLDRTTIIALTGNSASEDIKSYKAAGYSSHLGKPFKKEALIKTLCEHAQTLSAVKNAQTNADKPVDRFSDKCVKEVIARIDAELKDIVPVFMECRRGDIQDIQEALRGGDYETVRMIGHSMKGSGGSYGFDVITEIGLHIEDAAKGKNRNGVTEWVDRLSDYINTVEIVYE